MTEGNLYIGSTLRLMIDETEFVALDEDDNEYLNAGTATFTLTENNTGRLVDSGTLEYVASSDGRYAVEIGPYPLGTSSGQVQRNKRYTLLVNFEEDGEELTVGLDLKAVYQ